MTGSPRNIWDSILAFFSASVTLASRSLDPQLLLLLLLLSVLLSCHIYESLHVCAGCTCVFAIRKQSSWLHLRTTRTSFQPLARRGKQVCTAQAVQSSHALRTPNASGQSWHRALFKPVTLAIPGSAMASCLLGC